MSKTQSEVWFEEFCTTVRIGFERVEEEEQKTPDYRLYIDSQVIIAEIKEFARNKEECESDRLLEERGYGSVMSNTPGDRVRKKISDSSSQIKARTQGKHPSILILCDIKYGCGQVSGHTDPYNIRVGMYGLEQIHISVPQDLNISPYATGMSYGPKRKMTETQNTTISAIGVLSTPAHDDIHLDVYHNIYAAHPLYPTLMATYGIRQFSLVEQGPSTTCPMAGTIDMDRAPKQRIQRIAKSVAIFAMQKYAPLLSTR